MSAAEFWPRGEIDILLLATDGITGLKKEHNGKGHRPCRLCRHGDQTRSCRLSTVSCFQNCRPLTDMIETMAA